MEVFGKNQNSNEMTLSMNGTLFSFYSGLRYKQQALCVGCVRGNWKRIGIFSPSECVETLRNSPGTDFYSRSRSSECIFSVPGHGR